MEGRWDEAEAMSCVGLMKGRMSCWTGSGQNGSCFCIQMPKRRLSI